LKNHKKLRVTELWVKGQNSLIQILMRITSSTKGQRIKRAMEVLVARVTMDRLGQKITANFN
jgi:hypothetical protein